MNSDFARVSKLGFGCMRLPQTDPKDPTAIDIEHVKQMVRDSPPVGKRQLGRSDVHAPVELHGVRVDDLRLPERLGEIEGEGGLPGRGRADHRDHRS